ncbi:PKD domain-containing protein [Actinacidiphila paucisporea]|uniref:PKD domain-containing protein n=1 Tax=Actinacidiphila paucisporea TaxID=310782 RepID=A0A1M7QGG3_9ACTN|nr:PKD domain-containing protein [Actinacidiphila paucisporea]SHN29781.1 PKD domain-containing protein [Actinacidiphila paucisporea]
MPLRFRATAVAAFVLVSAAAGLPSAAPALAGTPAITAGVTVSPLPGSDPLAVTLHGKATADGSPVPDSVTYTYDFGDGTTPTVTSSPAVDHTYPAAGIYAPAVTAADASGTSTPAHLAGGRMVLGSGYNPLPSTRILDTRAGIGVSGNEPLRSYDTLTIPAAGRGGIPADGATAFVLNVTVTGGTAPGYLQVFPHFTGGPGSSVNWAAGQTIAAQVTVEAVAGGIDIGNWSTGSVHVVVDVQGYYSPAHGYRYEPVLETRVLDTRVKKGVPTTTPIPAGGSVTVTVPLPAHAPKDPQAVVVNVTATGSTRAGYVTAYGADSPRPAVSTVNWAAGTTVANLVTVPSQGGRITFYNHGPAPVHLIADLNGYYAAAARTSFRDSRIFRVLDTRSGFGTAVVAPAPAGGDISVPLPVPADLAEPEQAALLLRITVTRPAAPGVLLPFSGPYSLPLNASVLNWTTGQNIGNTINLSARHFDEVRFRNHSAGPTDLVVDLVGFFDTLTPPDGTTG